MTTQKLFKRRVRARMEKTGESYTSARSHVSRSRDRLVTDALDLASARELASDERLVAATGRDWHAWIAILDEWGGRQRTHPQIVAYLSAEHGVPPWWRQAVTNGFERATGMRAKHQQADGFTVYASKTVNVPVGVLFDAFVDAGIRRRWLRDGSMTRRSATPHKVARFDWHDGRSRIMVTFEDKGADKSAAAVSHERLTDAAEGEAAKAYWRRQLAALKAELEAGR
jgi:hypothetical protein